MKNELISIIIPLYNKEEYIYDCINSLINQSYKNIEIIIINDGSSDRSKEICESLVNKDKRIKLFNQANKGTYNARVCGIKKAKGSYVMFLDADDYLKTNAIEVLNNYISKNDYSVIRFNPLIVPDSIKNNYLFNSNKSFNKKEILNMLFNSNLLNSMCLCIYKKELFSNVKEIDKKILNGEDFLINLEVLSKVDKVLFIKDCLYYYRYNINSTTKKCNYDHIINNINNFIYCFDKYYDFIDNNYKMAASYKILEQTLSILFNLFNVNISKKDFINTCNKIMNNDVYNRVYKYMSYNDLKNTMKNKSFKYKIKHYINLCNFYKRKYNLIWYNKYVFKVIK